MPNTANSPTSPTLSRALTYPYPRPPHSYLFPTATPPPPLPLAQQRIHFSDPNRTAVLAIGSNAAPSQLARKFGPSTAPIPVLAVRARHLDVVYAALIAGYGAVPATVVHAPGCALLTHVTMLTAGQLRRMNETEGGYFLVRLDEGLVSLREAEGREAQVRVCFAYVAKDGPVLREERAVALEALEAEGRSLVACSQWEAQRLVQQVAVRKGVAGEGEGVEEFVERNVGDEDRRVGIVAAMREEWGACEASKVKGPWSVCDALGPRVGYETFGEKVVEEVMGIEMPRA